MALLLLLFLFPSGKARGPLSFTARSLPPTHPLCQLACLPAFVPPVVRAFLFPPRFRKHRKRTVSARKLIVPRDRIIGGGHRDSSPCCRFVCPYDFSELVVKKAANYSHLFQGLLLWLDTECDGLLGRIDCRFADVLPRYQKRASNNARRARASERKMLCPRYYNENSRKRLLFFR